MCSAAVDVGIVGAGVVGLTCARVLLERSHSVTIVAAERTPDTTSDRAAAIHFPFLVEPRARALRWAQVGLDRWRSEQVRWTRLFVPELDPWWGAAVAHPSAGVGPNGEQGTWCEVPVIHMPTYMHRTEEFLTAAGVQWETTHLDCLEEAPGQVVVNCSGLGARALCNDAVYPIRGQVVYLANEGVREAYTSMEPLTYIIPRAEDVVVGGTASQSWDCEPDPETERALVAKVRGIPGLGRVIGRAVGLRPARRQVRLDVGHLGDGRKVVHCYGHGGSGVTLSWGCAQDVADLLDV